MFQRPRWFVLCLTLFVFSCLQPQPFKFSTIRSAGIPGHNMNFVSYCNGNPSKEIAAVESSLIGDYQSALENAAKNAVNLKMERSINSDVAGKEILIGLLKASFEDPAIPEAERAQYRKLVESIDNQVDLQKLFSEYKPVDARDYIISKANDFRFLLINEAHYNSQNRAFTKILLKPLWEQGYKFLALEALNYVDTTLNNRKYPVMNSGYYTKDPVFGNLIREALELGFELVPYETRNGYSGTERDREMAENILRYIDGKQGKVLVHAGYSHIGENSSPSFTALGKHLKNMTGEDVFSVDQQTMTDLPDDSVLNAYYLYVKQHSLLKTASVFINEEVLVAPVHYTVYDIQVYHPATNFIHGRPDWLLEENSKVIPLPAEVMKFECCLIEARRKGEPLQAVPIDATVINPGTALILANGDYEITIVDCTGSIVATGELNVM